MIVAAVLPPLPLYTSTGKRDTKIRLRLQNIWGRCKINNIEINTERRETPEEVDYAGPDPEISEFFHVGGHRFFVGDTILRIWEHVKMPEAAAAQSAPWYTDIIFFGIATVIIVGICLLFKWIIRKRDK